MLQQQERERSESDDSDLAWFTEVFGYSSQAVLSPEEAEQERSDALFYFSNGSLGVPNDSFVSGLDMPTRALKAHETLSKSGLDPS